MKKLRTITKTFAAVFVVAAIFGMVFLTMNNHEKAGPCEGRQWESPEEGLECHYPNPPIGRWHAVYTGEFAKQYNLPPENISTDLSPGVDYMEMDVQPYGKGGTACLVNMLIKKPNDVAVFNLGDMYKWGAELHAHRKLSHMLDLDKHKDRLKGITTFGLASRNMQYDPKKTYGTGSSFAFHAEDIIDGYDYITANANCYNIISDPSRFPNGWAFNYAKASVWGRNEKNITRISEKEKFFNSRISINIPKEIISNVFKDMPIGGR